MGPPLSPLLARQLSGTDLMCWGLGCLLQGCIVVQGWHYFSTQERKQTDGKRLKAFLAALISLSFLDFSFLTVSTFRQFIVFRQVPYYADSLKGVDPILVAISGSACSGYFIRRCYKVLGSRKVFLAVVAPLWVWPIIAGLYLSVTLIGEKYNPAVSGPINSSWQACWIVLDLGITGILIHQFFRYKTGSSFPTTTSFLNKLIVLSFSTFFVVLLAQIVSLVLFYALFDSTAAASNNSTTRLQILSIFAHLSCRDNQGDSSSSQGGSRQTIHLEEFKETKQNDWDLATVAV